MDEDIELGAATEVEFALPPRHLVPMVVGGATVYVQQIGDVELEEGEGIYAVAPPSPTEAFQKAVEVIEGALTSIGDRVQAVEQKIHPDELTVELSLSFAAK